ncbi:tyrosine-type recombinase/integrase [Bradyrhizobium sp.]|uniref:tyrosine-type recombinase/integrase n=1 Tax=Bradyrhizobium sp. TaxID=376 RepID=UPI003C790060
MAKIHYPLLDRKARKEAQPPQFSLFGKSITSVDRKPPGLPYLGNLLQSKINMPQLKLTTRAVDKLAAPDPSGKQTLYWDSDLKGFAVLCSGTTTTKTYIVQRTLPDGRNRRVTVGPVNTLSLEKAKVQAADMLHDLRHGRDPKKKIANPTLRETLEAYLVAQKSLRPASIAVYRQVERTLTPWLDRPLREITGDMVEERHRAIAASIGKRGINTGAVTANGAMKTFRTLYNFAIWRAHDLPPNPVRRLKKNNWFPEPAKTTTVPEERMAEFYAALQNLPHPVQRDYLTFLLFTGLRRSEAAKLRWTDIDLSKRVIHVPAENTKTNSAFDLPMSDFVHALLVTRRSLGNAGYVFPGRSAGKPIIGTTMPLRTVAKATGVQVSAHDLRRTYATVAEEANVSWLAMKALLNHSIKGDITARHYPQLKENRFREQVQKVADEMKKRCGIVDVEGHNVAKVGP